MPVIVSRRTRTRQPQHPVGINWANPLTNGLVHANNWVDYRDIITGTVVTKTGTSDISPSVYGQGFDVTGLGNYIRNDNWASGPTTAGGCIVALWICNDTTATNGYIASFRDTTTGANRYYLTHNAGVFRFGWAATVAIATTATFTQGVPALVALSWDSPSTPKAYFNGAQVGSDTTTVSANPGVAYIGTASGSTASITGVGKHLLLLVYNRALSDAEHAALAANPWQIFEPEFDVTPYIPMLSGANVTQSNTSSTGNIGQTHILTGANASQANTSSTGNIAQSQTLTGSNASQANASTTGSISQTHILTGASVQQANQTTAGSIAQTHVLTGANCVQTNDSPGGDITQGGGIVLGTIVVGDLTMLAAPTGGIAQMIAKPLARSFSTYEATRVRR